MFNRDEMLSWRTRWPDTATAPWIEATRYQATSREALRACLAPFTVATVAPAQLLGLGTAYLSADDTIHAAMAFARMRSLMAGAPVADRAWSLSRIFSAYLDADLLPQALTTVAQLDALGPGAAGRRLNAHEALYDFAAQALDSIPFMAEQLAATRRAIGDLMREETGEAQKAALEEARGEAQHDWLFAWIRAIDLEGRRGDYEAMKRVGKEALAELTRIFPGAYFGPLVDSDAFQLGGAAPVLQSDFFYLPGQKGPTTTAPRPTRGKVSLFLSFPGTAFNNDDMRFYRLIDRLRRKYPSLEITLIAMETGIDMRRLERDFDPAVEGEKFREFIQDYLLLPLPVSVREAAYTTNPVNGRREQVPVADPYRDKKMVLVDKTGIIRFMDDHNFLRLEHMIQQYSR